MGRRLRSSMPSSTDQLLPKTVNPAIVLARLEHKQEQQKKYYDRSSRPLEHLSEGDDVYVQREGRWKPAIVLSKAGTPRSFKSLLKTVHTIEETEHTLSKKQNTSEENL